ncbi:MAG: hypothetical protein LBQ12_15990 [Deltaproteobacteria bacterium]|nr:hypothetical protein [Deltaproteobacteria bacterium]
MSDPNDAALHGPFDGLADVSGQGGIWAAIHKSLQAPNSAEKALVLKEFAQALKEAAPEAQATEGVQAPKKSVSVETLSARISMLIWFIGVFAGLLIAVVIGFMAFNQSNVGRLDARIGGLEDKVEARIGGLEAKMEARIGGLEARIGGLEAKMEARIGGLEAKTDARMGSLDARMDKFYGILMDLQKDIAKMQASQDEIKASLNR